MQWKDTDNVKAVARRNGKKQTRWKQQLDTMERNRKGESSRYIQWKEKDKTKAVATLNGKKQTKQKQQLDAMGRNKQGESNSWTQ